MYQGLGSVVGSRLLRSYRRKPPTRLQCCSRCHKIGHNARSKLCSAEHSVPGGNERHEVGGGHVGDVEQAGRGDVGDEEQTGRGNVGDGEQAGRGGHEAVQHLAEDLLPDAFGQLNDYAMNSSSIMEVQNLLADSSALDQMADDQDDNIIDSLADVEDLLGDSCSDEDLF